MSKKKLLAMLTGMVMAFMGLAGVGAASAETAPNYSLTVHKYLGATTDLDHNGSELSADKLTGKKPLSGVKFDVYNVLGPNGMSLPITTNEGIAVASKIGNMKSLPADMLTKGIEVDGKKYTLKKSTTITTGADGSATYNNAPMGLYVVVENLADSTEIKDGTRTVEKNKITPVDPFAVTLPMTNADGTGKINAVHVYPKNQENELDKKVVDKGVTTLNQGAKTPKDEFKYVLTTTSTGADVNRDGKMDAADLGNLYQIVDQLPANVEYVKTTAKIADPDTKDFTAIANTDDFDATTVKDGTPERTTVTVAFKGAGLNTIAGGAKIEVTLHVKLKSVPADGLTKNTGKLFPNEWSKKNDKPIKSPEVETRHGDIVIKKVDGAGEPLAGAIFSVHLPKEGKKDCSDLGPAIKTSGETGADGLVKISDLQMTDWIDGKAVPETDQVPYCLVEEQAPAGYQILPEPIKFSLTKPGTVATLSTAKAGDGNFVQITNHKNPGLPLTGAQGILLLSALGLILVSIGVVLTVKRRKD